MNLIMIGQLIVLNTLNLEGDDLYKDDVFTVCELIFHTTKGSKNVTYTHFVDLSLKRSSRYF